MILRRKKKNVAANLQTCVQILCNHDYFFLPRDLLGESYIEKYFTSDDEEVLIKPSNIVSISELSF